MCCSRLKRNIGSTFNQTVASKRFGSSTFVTVNLFGRYPVMFFALYSRKMLFSVVSLPVNACLTVPIIEFLLWIFFYFFPSNFLTCSNTIAANQKFMIKDQLDKNKKNNFYILLLFGWKTKFFLIQRYLYSLYNYEHEKWKLKKSSTAEIISDQHRYWHRQSNCCAHRTNSKSSKASNCLWNERLLI